MQIIPDKPVSLYQHLSPDEKVEVLFRNYYPALCKSLYRILKDVSLAEDIVQEVFLKVWDKRHSLQRLLPAELPLFHAQHFERTGCRSLW